MTSHIKSEVYIWYRNSLLIDRDAVKAAEECLSAQERDRRDRLQVDADRDDFTIAHDLLRRSLSKFSDTSPRDWRFVVDRYGKPSIDSGDDRLRSLSFSLSHSRGCVACAVTKNDLLGLDLERIDHVDHAQELADRYFSPYEAAWLRHCPDKLRSVHFAELWVLKEAFLKATGIGLSQPLNTVSFRFDERMGIEFSGPATVVPQEWHFALFEPVQNARLGLAVRSIERPRFFVRCDDENENTLAPIRASISEAAQYRDAAW